MVNYENLDNHQTGIHDYFKFLKFGFGRATDLACSHIRRGRLKRSDALDIVRRLDGTFPWEYLGKSLEDILDPLDITVDEFMLICDKFTNKKIFSLPRKFPKAKCLTGPIKGFTMRSSCAPYKNCKK